MVLRKHDTEVAASDSFSQVTADEGLNHASGPRQQQEQAEVEYTENVTLMWPHDCSEMESRP